VVESVELERAIAAVGDRIAGACVRAERRPEEVRLIAVTKGIPVEVVASGAAAGLTEFGENYVQELERKREAAPGARWHFLGRVQSNKARRIAEGADLIHGLEPGRPAERLAAAGTARGRAVRALVEVDFTGRRVGVGPDETEGFVDGVDSMDGLEVRGLMTIAPPDVPAGPYFARLRDLRDRIARRHPAVTELSMGMSADYEEAVEEGATMVRIGTAIFGSRP
jgi:PLP dependent protein